MNENYIIDGNAVYEIDSGCVEVGSLPDEYDLRSKGGKVYKEDNSTGDGHETDKTGCMKDLRGMDDAHNRECICNEKNDVGVDAGDCGDEGRVSVFF